MARRKFISLLLVIAMILTMIPIGPKAAKAEDQGLTYEKLKEAANTVLAKIAELDETKRELAIILLKHYAQIDEDLDGNGIDDGIDTLHDIILSFDSDNPDYIFGEELTNRVVNALESRGITIEQAANAVKLLTIWEVEDRVALIESLDSDNPIQFFATQEEEQGLINDILSDFPDMGTLFEQHDIAIDEFSFFAFAAQRAIGGPIFEDDIDGSIRFIQDDRFDMLKSTLNEALWGLTIRGRTFGEGTVDNLFSSFEAVIKERIVGKEIEAKSIFAKYDLYQSQTAPTIKLVPVYDIVDEDESVLVNVVLRNAQNLNINSMQVDINYTDQLRFKDIYYNGSSLIDSESPDYNEYDDYAEVIDTDTPGEIAYGFTFFNGGSWDITSQEEIIFTLEFEGKSIGMGQLDFSDVIMLTPENEEITDYMTVGSIVEVRGVSSVISPRIVNVQLENQTVSEGSTKNLSDNTVTVKGFVDPATSAVTINGESVTVSEIGEFTKVLTFEQDGTYDVEIVATNDGETDTFIFTIVVDTTGPEIIISGVEDNGIYNENKEITITVPDGTLLSATLNGEPFTSGSIVPVNEGEEQEFTLVVEAQDNLGNVSTKTVIFKIDKIAPIIEVNITDGYKTNSEVTINVTEETATVYEYTLTRNGEEVVFNNGDTLTEEGDYILVVTATDEAGNEAKETISFTIDKSLPTIEVNIEDGYVTNSDVTINVTEEAGIVYEYTLTKDGEEVVFNNGDTLTEEGEYVLVVTATDEAGNEAIETIRFTIDKTAPEIVVIGAQEGQIYNRTRILIAVNEGTYTATLNGESYTSGTLIDTSGQYILRIEAVDNVGNKATEIISFSIDADAPEVIDGTVNIDKTVVKAEDVIRINFEVNEAISEALLNVGYIDFGIPLDYSEANGKHIVTVAYTVPSGINAKDIPLRVVLKDSLGNTSEPIQLGTITIDNIAPTVFLYEDDSVEYGLNDYIVSDTLILHIATDGSIIKWAIDDGTEANMNVVNGNAVDITVDTQYSDGQEHTVYYLAEDEAGNISEVKSFTFKWINEVPQAPVITTPSTPTSEYTVDIEGTTEVQNPIIIVKKIIDGSEITVKVDRDGFPVNIDLWEGENDFIVYVKNEAGLISEGTPVPTIIRDTVNPLIEIRKVSDTEIKLLSNEDLFNVSYTLNDGAAVSLPNLIAQEESEAITIPFDEGTNTLIVTGQDAAGNIGRGRLAVVNVPEEITEDIDLGDDLELGSQTDDGALTGNLEVRSTVVDAEGNQEFVSEPVDFSGAEVVEGKTVVIDLDLGLGLPSNTKLYYYDESSSQWIALDNDPDHGDSYYNPSEEVVNVIVGGKDLTVEPGHLVAVLKHFSVYGAMADTTPPEVIITSPSEEDMIGGDGTVTVTGTVSETPDTLTINGVDAEVNGNQFTATITLTDGLQTVTATAIDAAGNEGQATVNVSVDTTAPVVSIIAPDKTKNNPENITVKVDDLNSFITKIYKTLVNIGNLLFSSSDEEFTTSIDLDEGQNTIIAESTDEYGNKTQQAVDITLDTIGPEITIIGVSDGDVTADSVIIDVELREEGTFTATLNEEIYIPGTEISEDGVYTLVVTAKDLLENQNIKEITFTIDSTKPKIEVNITDGYVTNSDVTINVTEKEGILYEYMLTRDGEEVVFNNGDTVTEEGEYTLGIAAVDEAGNEATKTIRFTIDKTAPVIEVTEVEEGGAYSEAVTPVISVTDNYDDNVEITATLNGNDYTLGTEIREEGNYVLVVTATDEAGKEATETISFTIDKSLPIIEVNIEDGYVTNSDVTINVTEEEGIVYEYTLTKDGEEVVFNNGDTVTEEGEYTLVVTAEDEAGNEATKTIRFTIDKTAPVIEVTEVEEGGAYSEAVTPVISVTDNYDDNVEITATLNGNDYTLGTEINEEGEYTLAVTATDEAGNQATVTISFTITLDDEPSGGGPSGGGSAGGGGGLIADDEESATITPEGGKLELLDEEVVIDIEEGTFEEEVEITAKVVEEDAVELPAETETAKLKLAGKVYEFDAGGKVFNKPVTITLKYETEKVKNAYKLGVYVYNEETKEWNYVGGKVDVENNTVTVTLEHFSKYAVMEYNKTFTDIQKHWAKEDIELMAARHIAKGMTLTEFMPDGNITRAQFATLLVRALGLELSDADNTFEDVQEDMWYTPYVTTAYEAGIVNGIDEKQFAPDANITREQMATMIMRAYSIVTGQDYNEMYTTTQVKFEDEAEISSWAHHAVIVAYDLGIINGMTETTFVPKDNATRAQGIVMIKRLLDATDSF